MSDHTPDTQLRIEALRLAVAAGAPELRKQFYAFLTDKGDQTPASKPSAAFIRQLEDEIARLRKGPEHE